VCRRLDGIPLALELAAGRIRELTADQIASRLDERFRLLVGGSSPVTHQQTLGAAIGWSYDLLSEAERTLLGRLSVFAGGWDLEAAEVVAGGQWPVVSTGGPTPTTDHRPLTTILDVLSGLIDKSWVVGEDAPHGRRYRLLESVREFGRERLRGTAEETDLRE